MDFPQLRQISQVKWDAVMDYINEANQKHCEPCLLLFSDNSAVRLWFSNHWRFIYYSPDMVRIVKDE